MSGSQGDHRRTEPTRIEWDQVLRGLVFEAWSLRGTDEFTAALHAIVDAFYAWPLVEALHYIDEARQLLAEHDRERDDEELRWYAEVFSVLDRRRTTEMAA